MKATGVVRRIDDLGRIVIPKEIRRTLRIREGDPLEVYVDNDGEVILKKYSHMGDLAEFAEEYVESIYSTVKQNIFITDRDKIIACAGPLKKKYINKSISEFLVRSIERRDNFIERHKKDIELIDGNVENGTFCISAIIANGDSVGLVIILSDTEDLTDIEEKTTQIAAQFLGKQIEQ